MNLGDVIKAVGRTIPGKIGIAIFIFGIVMGAFYKASEIALSMDIGSLWMEEGARCGRSLELAEDALKSGDPSEMIEDARQGNCMGQKYINSAKEIGNDAGEVLNPLSLPDPKAPTKLFESSQKLDKAASNINHGMANE